MYNQLLPTKLHASKKTHISSLGDVKYYFQRESKYPNTVKQMKAQRRRPGAFIVSRCLDTPMKHEAQVLEITFHA